MAIEKTRAFGDIMLEAMKEKVSPNEMGRRVSNYASGLGVELDETDLTMIVGGYSVYFSSKGIV